MSEMFLYNVTFIHRDWCLSTTVESLYEDDEAITNLAYLQIANTLTDISRYKFVDIEVEYIGEDV